MHEGFRAVHSEAAQRNKNQLGGFDTEKKQLWSIKMNGHINHPGFTLKFRLSLLSFTPVYSQ